MTAPADGPDAPQSPATAPDIAFPPGWQRTLFLMMGIQLGMNMGFTVLSPVMPLFLPQLGVQTGAPVDLWAGVDPAWFGQIAV